MGLEQGDWQGDVTPGRHDVTCDRMGETLLPSGNWESTTKKNKSVGEGDPRKPPSRWADQGERPGDGLP